jgi:hypothetical protein
LVAAAMTKRGHEKVREAPRLLAPLRMGDQLRWRLSSGGEPEWLVMIDVIDETR